MACNGASCQSGCYNEITRTEEQKLSMGNKAVDGGGGGNGNNHGENNMCLKCKAAEAIVAAGGDAGGRFCADCFRSNLYGKFKFAVTSNAMISPTDKVLVAFSGGPSSRVVLQFVHEMQLKAQKNFDATASIDRSLPVFGVGVAFIDESEIHHVPSHDLDKAVEDMKEIVLNLAPPRKELHVVPIRSVYSTKASDGRERLKDLISAVTDATGKEDLVAHLRMLSLQKIACENGYTKLVLGSCTSRIACHVLAATVKGQGFSLAADIQYADARWEIPVVLPLRDCLMQELNILCSLDSLKIVEISGDPRDGINGLVSSFVKLLQEENPSREYTIVRTAGKLTPFPFNRIPEANDDYIHMASQRRQKKFDLKPIEFLAPKSFCPICNSPRSDYQGVSVDRNGQTTLEGLAATCCYSCQYQILPKESSSVKQLFSLLPDPIIARARVGKQSWIREKLQDCLLSDDEDKV